MNLSSRAPYQKAPKGPSKAEGMAYMRKVKQQPCVVCNAPPPSDAHHCFDRNSDGKVDVQTECFGTHEWVIPLPSEAARRSEIPFKWVGLNWNHSAMQR